MHECGAIYTLTFDTASADNNRKYLIIYTVYYTVYYQSHLHFLYSDLDLPYDFNYFSNLHTKNVNPHITLPLVVSQEKHAYL